MGVEKFKPAIIFLNFIFLSFILFPTSFTGIFVILINLKINSPEVIGYLYRKKNVFIIYNKNVFNLNETQIQKNVCAITKNVHL